MENFKLLMHAKEKRKSEKDQRIGMRKDVLSINVRLSFVWRKLRGIMRDVKCIMYIGEISMYAKEKRRNSCIEVRREIFVIQFACFICSAYAVLPASVHTPQYQNQISIQKTQQGTYNITYDSNQSFYKSKRKMMIVQNQCMSVISNFYTALD